MNASPKSRRRAPAHEPQQAELNEAASAPEPQSDAPLTPDPPREVAPAEAPASAAEPEVILAIESQTTTALALVTQHVSAIQAFSAGVAELERQYVGIVFPVETTVGMKEACKAREVIREPRYAIQNLAKEAKGTLNNLKNEVDQQAESYIARITAIEAPIHEQIVNENNRKAAEKKAKEEAEEKRKAVIEERINDMREAVALVAGKSAADIAVAIGDIESVVVDQTFAEFQQRAEAAKAATLGRLKGLHAATLTLEAEQKRLEEVRERLAREKAEQDAAAAKERARIAEENRQAEEARQLREQADDEIRTIQQIPVTADRHGTLEKYDEAIRVAAAWVIDDALFGLHSVPIADALNDARALLLERREILTRKFAAEANAKAKAEARERAMDAIRAIQDRVHTAAEGDSLEAYDLAISVTQGEVITEERFGDLVEAAETAQTNTLTTLRQRQIALAKRLASEQELAEQRRQQEAESQRLADESAELARQQEAREREIAAREAALVSREMVAPASHSSEATDSPAESAATEDARPSSIVTVIVQHRKPVRPSDVALVKLFAHALSVDWDTMVEWLRDMDLEALAQCEGEMA